MSSQETENHFRILLLLLDGAALVERKVFESKVTGTLASFLFAHHGVLHDLHKKKVINYDQLTLLNSSNPSSADFDISLLTCLLRNICGLAIPSGIVWTIPSVNDFSTEADITRLKSHRNKISHQPGVGISQTDFQHEWSEICQILHRLNLGLKHDGIHDLQKQLDVIKTCCIDQGTAKQYENKLQECKELEMAQHNVLLKQMENQYSALQNSLGEIKKSQVKNQQISVLQHERTREEIKEGTTTITRKLEKLKLSSPEQEHLIDCSKCYFDEANKTKEIFVITNSYKIARKKLGKSGFVVLSGHPGEGKTSMAQKLLLESSPLERILKLSDPSDWRRIPKGYSSILIDDIFGCNILNDQLLCPWDRVLPELNMLVRQKKLAAIVITTRHYILNEAKPMLRAKEMFKHVVTLSSEDLSQTERLSILNKHLNAVGRNMKQDEKDRICSAKGSDDDKQMIGFPACTAMFTTNDTLFTKGSDFFKSPYEFFLECLEGISINEDKFMSLVLVWVSESHVLELDKIEKLVDVAKDFSYTKLGDDAKLRENLAQLEQCFLTYDDNEETYTFRYHIIADAVGIVAARKHNKAVIKYAGISFIRRHVTIGDDPSKHIKVKKKNYKVLVDKFDKLLFVEGRLDAFDDIQHHSKLPEISGMLVATSNISILQYEALDNVDFVKEYLNPQNMDTINNCLRVPILDAYKHFKNEYHISFQKDQIPLCMPSALLALGKDTMITECLQRKLLTKAEKDVSLLLAVKNKRINLVKDLLKADAEITEDSLTIAAKDTKSEVYKLLVGQRITENTLPHVGITWLDNTSGSDDSTKRSAREYIYEVVLYILGCKLLIGRNSDVLPLERQTTQSVYWSGWEEFLQKVRQYKPPRAFASITSEIILNVIARHADTTLVRVLLSKNPFNQYSRLMKSKIGNMSLFHKAVVENDKLLLQSAIELGLDPNRRDVYGRSPINLAACYDKEMFVSTLARIPHIDLELADRNRLTPLHAAVWNNSKNAVSLLVDRVNVNCRDNRGNTPLHLACKKGLNDIIYFLLNCEQIDVGVVNKVGDTVYRSLRSYCALQDNPKREYRKLMTWFQIYKRDVPGVNKSLANNATYIEGNI